MVDIKNGKDRNNVRAYVWLCLPHGENLYFDGTSWTSQVTGIPFIIPPNLEREDVVLANFTIPPIMPEGFYNFNAQFVEEHGDRGPMGTWNFYVGD